MNPTTFPPPDYEQAASTVPGITVWQPRAVVTTIDAPKTFTCPQCGATTRYDIAAGGVACEYCGYVQPSAASTQAAPIGRRAQEFEFTLETLSQAEQGWGVARRELSCDNCGASLTLPETVITATCPFCASNSMFWNWSSAAVARSCNCAWRRPSSTLAAEAMIVSSRSSAASGAKSR